MEPIEELVRLVDALDAERVEYAVCGGIALAIHGHPRFTKDIELLVEQRDSQRLQALASERRFPALDLVFVSAALGAVWSSRQFVEWCGRKLNVVSREGLIRMKRLSGRMQDLADIEALNQLDGDPAMGEKPPGGLPPPEVVERRLRELTQLYVLGQALREMRFVEPPRKPATDRVRERPDEC